MNNFKQTNKKRRIDTTFSNRARIRTVTGKKLRRKSEQQQQKTLQRTLAIEKNPRQTPADRQIERIIIQEKKKRKPTRKGRIFSHETMGTRHKGERACAA